MECQEVRELMSDYLEQYLAEPDAALVAEHLGECGDCQTEYAELEETLRVVHNLPQQEPVFDLWTELAPKCADIRFQEQLTWLDQVHAYFTQFILALREGWEIFMTTVSYNMRGKIRTMGD